MRKHKMIYGPILLGMLMVFLLVSCAEVTVIDECRKGEPAGFWSGLWHGLIAPFSFVMSLFSDRIAMYAINNNGGWYDFGFVLGASILFGGGNKASKSRK